MTTTATPYPSKKAAFEPEEVNLHRIRVTLSSLDVAALEKGIVERRFHLNFLFKHLIYNCYDFQDY
jgi:hypothetical protein